MFVKRFGSSFWERSYDELSARYSMQLTSPGRTSSLQKHKHPGVGLTERHSVFKLSQLGLAGVAVLIQNMSCNGHEVFVSVCVCVCVFCALELACIDVDIDTAPHGHVCTYVACRCACVSVCMQREDFIAATI